MISLVDLGPLVVLICPYVWHLQSHYTAWLYLKTQGDWVEYKYLLGGSVMCNLAKIVSILSGSSRSEYGYTCCDVQQYSLGCVCRGGHNAPFSKSKYVGKWI